MSRPLRFEGKTMEAARQRARDHLGSELSELNVLRHGRELTGGIFGFFQRERFVIELAEPTSSGPRRRRAPEAPPLSQATGESLLPDRLSALLESTTDTVGVCFDRELQGILHDAEAVVSDAAGIYTTVPTNTYPPPASARQTPAPVSAPVSGSPALPVSAAVSFAPAGMSGPTFRERLADAGLAEQYLPDPLFSAPALALPLRLGTIAPVRPVLCNAGEVLLLVGDVDESLAVAGQLARKLDSDQDVLVVSHRRLSPSLEHPRARTPLEAGTMVLERRLQGLTSLVVLDSASRSGFGPRILAALRPEAVWAVVPASWDERRTRSLESLIGRFDALVLYDLLASGRPAGLIGRGWPIAYIDGWEATPLSIAARLVEAVEALDAAAPAGASEQARSGSEA